MTCGPIPLSSNYNMRIYNVLQIKETRVILICKNFYLVKKFVCKQQHKSRSFSEAVRNFNQARIRANACFRLYRSLRAAYSHVDRTRRKKQKKRKKQERRPLFWVEERWCFRRLVAKWSLDSVYAILMENISQRQAK